MTRHRYNIQEKDRVKQRKHMKNVMTKVLLILNELNDLEDNNLILLLQKNYHRLKLRRHLVSKQRRCRQRKSWNDFQSKLTDRQFRRYFRMHRDCFDFLCHRIKENVGEDEFKSESFLRHLVDDDKPSSNILLAHRCTSGGFVSGEVKVALTLRLLAGGAPMDLSLLFEVGFSTAYNIFHQVIKDWILDDRLVKINGMDYCQHNDWMSRVALGFAVASKNVINGCIGAIDGWIVKIRKPLRVRDLYNTCDPGSYFSRKGFFGINVQAIVDRQKRVLYRNIINRGAEHDSTAFRNSNFYSWLMDNSEKLLQKGFYFIGDSAYAIKSFIITPFDNAVHGTPEDAYNFFHSSSRIMVECCFGEINMRWGILWKPLQFRLKHNVRIIDACMRLHNFIVDWREEHLKKSTHIDDQSIFEEEHRRFMAVFPDIDDDGVHGGEEDARLDADGNPYVGGRPSRKIKQCSENGKKIRQIISDDIQRKKLVRPKVNWFRKNNRVLHK